MGEKKVRVRMNVSIASADWSAQPGQVIETDAAQAKKFIRSGLASAVAPTTPLSTPDIFDELSAEEARRRVCACCEKRRGAYALRNQSLCPACYRAALGGMR